MNCSCNPAKDGLYYYLKLVTLKVSHCNPLTFHQWESVVSCDMTYEVMRNKNVNEFLALLDLVLVILGLMKLGNDVESHHIGWKLIDLGRGASFTFDR